MGWTAFPLIIGGLILTELQMPSWLDRDPVAYLAIISGVLFALFQYNLHGFEKVHASVNSQARDFAKLKTLLQERESLLKMEAAVLELETILRQWRPTAPVIIEHLGLDMTLAWRDVESLIRRLTFIRELEYRILVLAGSGSLSSYPSEVQDWLRMGRKSRVKIDANRQKLERGCSTEGRIVRCVVREYCDTPVVHGFRIRSPDAVGFVSLCRWTDEGRYDWGGEAYRKIARASCTPSQGDLLNMFDSSFAHHWTAAQPR